MKQKKKSSAIESIPDINKKMLAHIVKMKQLSQQVREKIETEVNAAIAKRDEAHKKERTKSKKKK